MSVHASAITAQIDAAHRGSTAPTAPADGSEQIDHLRSLAVKFLNQHLQTFNKDAEQFLFDLAGNTQDEDLHTLYLDTISRLRNSREAVKRATLERFNQLIKDPGSCAVSFTTTSQKIDKLLLSGDDDLESTLAIKHLIALACERHKVNLEAIEDIHGQLCDNALPNPLSPTLFCLAWKEAIDTLDAPLDTRTITYRLFAKFVINNLGQLYERALSELGMQGISPRVRRNAPITPAAKPTAATATARKTADADPEALTRELVIKRCVEILKSDTARKGNDARTRAIVDALTLLQGYLDVLQPVSANHNPGRDEGDMVHYFSCLMHISYGDGLRPEDRQCVESVRGIIDALLNDLSIDGRARQLIARLQIPALKVAFLDSNFISTTAHPLRVLLQRISSITQANDDPNSDFSKARVMVSRIASDLRQDVAILGAIVGNPVNAVEQTHEPEPAPIAAPAINTLSRQIEKRIKGRRIPDSVRAFIDTVWTPVLDHYLHAEDQPSDAFQSALVTVDELVTVMQPYDHAAHHERVMETVPGLLCKIQSGLAAINFDRALKNQLFTDLIAVHARSIHFKKSNNKRPPQRQ